MSVKSSVVEKEISKQLHLVKTDTASEKVKAFKLASANRANKQRDAMEVV